MHNLKPGWVWFAASVTLIPLVFWTGGCDFERGPWTMACLVMVLASVLFGLFVFED